MKYSILRRLSFTFLFVFVYCKAHFLNAVEPEDILAPAIGPVVILPKATLSIGYDDNVFLSGDNIKNVEDVITTFSPGVALQYGQNILDSNYIAIDYSPSFLWYSENNELNTDNHSLAFGINYQKEGKFTFSGTDNITLSNTLLRGRERTFFSTLEDDGSEALGGLLIKKFASLDEYRFEYTISPKTSVYILTSANVVDYEEEPHYYYKTIFGDLTPYALFDVSNWNNTVGFGWQALPKIKFYGSFFYGKTYVESNLKSMGDRPDSDFFGGHISANGEFSDKLSVRLQFGYQTRSFDKLFNGIGGGSHSLPIYEAAIDYDYSGKGTMDISYRRGGNVSIENPKDAIESDFLALSVDQGLGNSRKWSVGLNSTFRLDSRDTRDALEYEYLRVGAGLTYAFNQWFRSTLTYNLELFNSNQGSIDYNVNRVMLGLTLGY